MVTTITNAPIHKNLGSSGRALNLELPHRPSPLIQLALTTINISCSKFSDKHFFNVVAQTTHSESPGLTKNCAVSTKSN